MERKVPAYKDICTRMLFIVELFTVAKNWKQVPMSREME